MIGKRILWAAILFGLFFVSLWLDPLWWLLGVMILAFGVLCLTELTQLIRVKDLRFPYVLGLALLLLLWTDGYFAQLRHGLPILAVTLLVLLTHRVLECDYTNVAAEVGSAFLAIGYVGLPMAMAAAVSQMTDVEGAALGEYLLIYQAVVVFSGDSAAYFVGRNWGKTPFFPKISPRKTVEGAAACLGVSAIVSVLLTLFLPALRHFLGIGHGLLLGLVLGLVVPLGDLAESAFKRDAGRKDSGSDFTGHGGFLDIFDSLLFGLPVQFFYIELFLAKP